MSKNFANSSYTIAAGKTVAGKLTEAGIIQIACGRVWLTVAGENNDFWLDAGESMFVPANRLIVIEAEKQACLVDVSDISAVLPVRKPEPTLAMYMQRLSGKLNHTFA